MTRTQATCVTSALLLGTLGLGTVTGLYFTPHMPPLSLSLSSPVSQLSDFIGIAVGFRKLTCDVAWIQTLVYYGTQEEELDSHANHRHEEPHSEVGKYPLFLAYCQRVAQIDPSFKYIYYYGAAVLGWNLERPQEAELLLKQGIAAHPQEWKYKQFLAGLAYQKNHNINDLMTFLEAFIKEKECPNVLRSILANLYKKEHRYREAIRVWMLVYDTQDPMYLKHAVAQIELMAPLAGLPTPSN